MLRLRRAVGLSLVIPALVSTGCVRLHGPEDIRRDLSRSAGVKLQRETGITVTRSGVWLARRILKWTHADEEMPISLKGLRRVQVGVYEVEGLRRGVEAPMRIDFREHFDESWTPLVRVHDDDETVLVLTQAGKRPGQLRAMLVVVVEEDEWVLVQRLLYEEQESSIVFGYGFDTYHCARKLEFQKRLYFLMDRVEKKTVAHDVAETRFRPAFQSRG